MNSIHIRKTKSLFVLIVILALSWVVLFGVSFGMEMRSDGIMEHCLFSDAAVICPMSIFEHLNAWNNMFATNLPKARGIYLTLIILFLSLALAVTVLRRKLNELPKSSIYQKLYLKQKPYLLYFEYLKEAFSQGIIKPKIYK